MVDDKVKETMNLISASPTYTVVIKQYGPKFSYRTMNPTPLPSWPTCNRTSTLQWKHVAPWTVHKCLEITYLCSVAAPALKIHQVPTSSWKCLPGPSTVWYFCVTL